MDYSNIIIAACTAIGTILAVWGLFHRFSDKLDKRFDKIDQRFDKVEAKLDDVVSRVSRIEGAVWGGHTETDKAR